MSSIEALHAKAERQQKAMNAAAARHAKAEAARLATVKKRQNAILTARQKIGTLVRKTYLQNNRITQALMQHGGLTPANARAAGIAFHSPAFHRAALNKAKQLRTQVGKYRNMWGAWYRGLPANQRAGLYRNLIAVLRPDTTNPIGLKYVENPVFFVKKGLMARPAAPTNSATANLRHQYKWRGANTALRNLANPAANAVLRRYGLPFSMAQARQNLFGSRVMTAQNVEQLNYRLRRTRNNQRAWNQVKPNMSLARAGGALPARPPKGLKWRARKKALAKYKQNLQRALW
jgi:hypothetical protein